MKINKKQIVKTVNHPMEDFLNIENNTTVMTKTERQTEISPDPSYDAKDFEIEELCQEIYDKALTTFEDFKDELEVANNEKVPRLGEVAAQFLDIALKAIDKKMALKQHKDKIVQKNKSANAPKNLNQTIIINREDLLKQIKSESMDVEFEEIGKENDQK